jgi:predicted HNH restriction endonuclease
MSIQQFLDFAIQCCNCLEMIHKHQSIYLSDLKCISSTVFTNSTNYT